MCVECAHLDLHKNYQFKFTLKRKSAGSAVTTTFTKEVMTNHGMNQGKSCGILLANGEKIKNNCVVLGKTLELQGIFVSGKVLIPLGR